MEDIKQLNINCATALEDNIHPTRLFSETTRSFQSLALSCDDVLPSVRLDAVALNVDSVFWLSRSNKICGMIGTVK